VAPQIFKNIAHQELFEKQGFLVLPFLKEEEIAHLDQYFNEEHPDLDENGFFAGSYSPDFVYKKRASDKIVSVFSRAYEETFINYAPFGGAFLYKTPGVQSELAAHQDWTIVDEEKEIALNCWVPLCDITIENGPLMILPGSQYPKHPVLRAPTLPFFFSGNDDLVKAELEPMLVKAGTAVILNQSVIHYSLANHSQHVRKAITAGVKSADAQMYFHYKLPNEDKLEVFQEDDDFLLRFDNFLEDIGQRPKNGISVGFKDYQLPTYTRSQLQELLIKLKTEAGFSVKSKQIESEAQIETKSASFFDTLKTWLK